MALLAATCLALFTALAFPQAAQPTPSDEIARAHDVIAALAAGDFDRVETQFDDKMKAAVPPARLAVMWANLLTEEGAYQRCAAESRVRVIADKQMVITTCQFELGSADLQFAFDPEKQIAGMAMRPAPPREPAYTLPPYADAAKYRERDLTIGSGQWSLPGTLDMPAGRGPFPLVVLVHGSGPGDRDETVGAEKPFRDLGLGLASEGVAVLRYDKRTRVYPKQVASLQDFTVKDETIDDALEAVKTARSLPGIDPSRVFVLGHSLGGMLIPRIAARDPQIAGLVVIAGPAIPVEQALVNQARYVALLDGSITPAEQAVIDEASATAKAIEALTPSDLKSGPRLLNAPASYWLDLRGYDPPAAAQAVKQPLLILQGERDFQVTMTDFAKWKAALAGRPTVTFRSYPGLNHLFVAGTGPSVPQEYAVPGHVAAAVLRDIADWIVSISGDKR